MRDSEGALIPPEQVFFEVTKEEKLARAGALGCDCFIDDLPEILLSPHFPKDISPLLFDPDGIHADQTSLVRLASWRSIAAHIGVEIV